MISYIKGEITFKTPTYILVEAGSIGYQVNISLNTYAQIEKMDRVKILTYLHVKEDSHTLYGFASEGERTLFKQLISVSGIGPNTARVLLSAMTTEEARDAIVLENLVAFKKVKGVGPKTAKLIILNLKDKIIKDGGAEVSLVAAGNNTIRDEALSALVALGFNKTKVQKTVNQLISKTPSQASVEILIKEALKELS